MSKWLFSFILGIVFVILSSPLMYKISGSVLHVTTEQGGVPTPTGVIIHMLVFVMLIRLILYIQERREGYSFYDGFQGLANPAGMKTYNTAYLQAQDLSCPECMKAIQNCMQDPYDKDCQKGIQKSCKDPTILNTVKKAQEYISSTDWSTPGSCPYVKEPMNQNPEYIY